LSIYPNLDFKITAFHAPLKVISCFFAVKSFCNAELFGKLKTGQLFYANEKREKEAIAVVLKTNLV